MAKQLIKQGGVIAGIDDPLVLELGRARDTCCDELGVAGCFICPVVTKCRSLWREVEEATNYRLSYPDYRRLSQQFYRLKQERDGIFETRRRDK